MGKLTLAILGATTALALSGGPAAAYTATIYDSLNVPGTGAYSHGAGGGGSGGSIWGDNYNGGGGDDFYSGNAYVTWSGNDVIIELTTNLPLNGSPQTGDTRYGFADVFFDLKAVDGLGGANTPDWDFGLDINSGAKNDVGALGFGQNTSTDTSAGAPGVSYKTVTTEPVLGAGNKARLVTLDSTADYAYSVKNQIEWTKICTDGVDCGPSTSGRRPEVEILETAYSAEYDVQTLGGPNPPNPPDFTYRIVLAGVNAGGLWNEFRLFWGTGWCANDTVEGYVTRIPVPAALPIIASALAGFGFAGWRQRKAVA